MSTRSIEEESAEVGDLDLFLSGNASFFYIWMTLTSYILICTVSMKKYIFKCRLTVIIKICSSNVVVLLNLAFRSDHQFWSFHHLQSIPLFEENNRKWWLDLNSAFKSTTTLDIFWCLCITINVSFF